MKSFHKLLIFLCINELQEVTSKLTITKILKPIAPILAWYALALSPIYGNGEFTGKASGLGAMTDFTIIQNRNGPTVESNEYIVAPRGFCKYARVVEAPKYKVSTEKLYDTIEETLRKELFTTFIKADKTTLRLEFVQRTPIFQFPDVITVQAIEDKINKGESTIAMHSYSIYGGSDLGTNKKRVKSFLEDIQKSVDKNIIR